MTQFRFKNAAFKTIKGTKYLVLDGNTRIDARDLPHLVSDFAFTLSTTKANTLAVLLVAAQYSSVIFENFRDLEDWLKEQLKECSGQGYFRLHAGGKLTFNAEVSEFFADDAIGYVSKAFKLLFSLKLPNALGGMVWVDRGAKFSIKSKRAIEDDNIAFIEAAIKSGNKDAVGAMRVLEWAYGRKAV